MKTQTIDSLKLGLVCSGWLCFVGCLAESDFKANEPRRDTADTATDTSDTGARPSSPPDIMIENVYLNQAVDIQVGQDGMAVDIADWTAPVVAQRPALVRVTYTLLEHYSPRNIVAQLILENEGGTDTYLDERFVEEESAGMTWDETFQWRVEAGTIGPETLAVIQLAEPSGQSDRSSGQVLDRYPTTGSQAWEASANMRFELVVVPVECDGVEAPDVSGTDLENFEGFLYNTFPVSELSLTVHETVYSPSCSTVEMAENELQSLRIAEGSPPGRYYGAILPELGAQESYGYATGGDTSQPDYRRNFASVAWRDEGLSSDLFAHELAHSHGRPHSFEDSEYPYVDQSTTGQSYCGIRNTVGYGARSVLMPKSGWGNDVSLGLEWFDPSQTLIPATSTDDCHSQPSGNMFNHNDLTSYTYPYWVSDYTYGLLAEQIALVDSWEAGSESNTCRTKDRTVQWRRFEDGKIKQGRGFKSTELTDAPLRCVSQAGVGWFPASRRSVSLDVRTARGIGQEVMELIEFAPPDGFVGQCDVWGIQRPAQYRD